MIQSTVLKRFLPISSRSRLSRFEKPIVMNLKIRQGKCDLFILVSNISNHMFLDPTSKHVLPSLGSFPKLTNGFVWINGKEICWYLWISLTIPAKFVGAIFLTQSRHPPLHKLRKRTQKKGANTQFYSKASFTISYFRDSRSFTALYDTHARKNVWMWSTRFSSTQDDKCLTELTSNLCCAAKSLHWRRRNILQKCYDVLRGGLRQVWPWMFTRELVKVSMGCFEVLANGHDT